jgi:hypothetical protein
MKLVVLYLFHDLLFFESTMMKMNGHFLIVF